MDAVSFQQRWVGASNLKERTASQTHFYELSQLLEVPKPFDVDHAGETYTFEKGAAVAGGGDGGADVWHKGHFAWEYKGRGKDLDAAYKQLLIVSDLDVIRVHTNFTNTVKRVIEFDLNSLTAPGTLNPLRRIWTDPQSFDTGVTVEKVIEEAADRFSRIALGLHQRGGDPAATAHFILQMVFCLFAKDIKLLPDRIFSEMVKADQRALELFRQGAQTLLEARCTPVAGSTGRRSRTSMVACSRRSKCHC